MICCYPGTMRSALGSGQLISQFCHFPEASRHKEGNVLSHTKLSGSGEPERLRLTNPTKLMLMPGQKPRAGVLGHEGEMRCSLGHLYHRGGLHPVPISVSLQGQSRRKCSTFIRTSGKWAAHSLPGRVWEERGENPISESQQLPWQTSRVGTLCTAAEDVEKDKEARKWWGNHKQEALVLDCR